MEKNRGKKFQLTHDTASWRRVRFSFAQLNKRRQLFKALVMCASIVLSLTIIHELQATAC